MVENSADRFGTELGNPGAHSTSVSHNDGEHAAGLVRTLRMAVPCIALRLNKHGNTVVYGVEPDSDLIGKVAPGDVVMSVEGRPTEARTPAEVRELLRGACFPSMFSPRVQPGESVSRCSPLDSHPQRLALAPSCSLGVATPCDQLGDISVRAWCVLTASAHACFFLCTAAPYVGRKQSIRLKHVSGAEF